MAVCGHLWEKTGIEGKSWDCETITGILRVASVVYSAKNTNFNMA